MFTHFAHFVSFSAAAGHCFQEETPNNFLCSTCTPQGGLRGTFICCTARYLGVGVDQKQSKYWNHKLFLNLRGDDDVSVLCSNLILVSVSGLKVMSLQFSFVCFF